MLRNRRGVRSSLAFPQSPLFLSVAGFVTVWTLFGGARSDDIPTSLLLGFTGSCLLAVSIGSGSLAEWRSLGLGPRLLIIFTILMPLLQLIPLPPGIIRAMPGRALPDAILASSGAAGQWHPVTLNVGATFQSVLLFIWLAGLLFALLRLSSDELRWVFGLVFVLGLVNIAIGVIQVASGGRALQLHTSLHTGFLLGVFANKNHTGLFIALALLAGYATRYAKTGWRHRDWALGASVAIVLMGALFATFSRTGIVFGFLSLGYVLWMSFEGRLQRTTGYSLLGAGVLLAISGAIIATTAVAGRSLERFAGLGQDLRWSIWPWSWPLVEQYFPFGAGIGSFEHVFKASEKLAWVKPTYVNNVHNEYIEQLIELGIAAPVFWMLVVAAFSACLPAAWSLRHRQSGRLALVGAAMMALFALHSVFDYPLRRPALAVICMLATAAVFRAPAAKKRFA